LLRSGRRLDQPLQRCTHRIVEISIGEAALQFQPRNNPLNEDAALLKRYAVGGGPDGPKLRIAEDDHVTMVLPVQPMSTARVPWWPSHGRSQSRVRSSLTSHKRRRVHPVGSMKGGMGDLTAGARARDRHHAPDRLLRYEHRIRGSRTSGLCYPNRYPEANAGQPKMQEVHDFVGMR
jgi:hypothetical protein